MKIKIITVINKLRIFVTEKINFAVPDLTYRIKKRIYPQNYLSSKIKGGSFPKIIRTDSIKILPESQFERLILILIILIFFFFSDISIKKWLFINFKINLEGIGTLRDLGGSAWQVLATVISVGLATIGIILQAISQEKNVYRRKLLLHHYFTTQQLDFKIIYSFLVLFLSGVILVFKEKLFFYPVFSEHIYIVFIFVGIFVYIFARLIIKSFDYLFPENQDKYFDYSLQKRLLNLIKESARSLILIDVLQSYLDPLGIGIKYLYDEQDKKKPNMAVIETSQKGRIDDIDISILSKLSKTLGEKYIKEEKGKLPISAEIYIEYGRPEQRTMQPLAIIHKDNYSEKIINLFKQAILLSTSPPPKIENDLREYLEWAWDKVRDDLNKDKTEFTKNNLRNLYDFYENVLTIFDQYKKIHKIEEGSTLDKWDFLNDFRQQYFTVIDSAYQNKKAIEPLFSLNYFPFALMQRAIHSNNRVQYTYASDLLGWVYKDLFKLDHPRQNDLRENFFLSNLNFAQFYLLGGKENFEENFKKREFYLLVYLKAQINFIRRALELGDKKTIYEVVAIVAKLIKETSYWQEEIPYVNLKDDKISLQEQFKTKWEAMFLGIQSWAFKQYEAGNIDKDLLLSISSISPWIDLFNLTKNFSIAIEQDIEHIMSWDWWDLEKRSYLENSGSFGGFENIICKWYSLQAIKFIAKLSDNEVSLHKRLIKDQDTYFKLLISDNGTIKNYLNVIKTNNENLLFLFDNMDKNSFIKNIEKLECYLKLTLNDNETSRRQAIVSASLDQKKLDKFKKGFISGYTINSKLRKIIKFNNDVVLNLKQTGKPFYGIHILLPKEPFTSLSTMDYEDMGEHYGQQMAQIEDYFIVKNIFNKSKSTIKRFYNATNVKQKLDGHLKNLSKKQIGNMFILILGSPSLRQELTRDPEYKWAVRNKSNTFDEYRGLKIYWTSIGKENGVVVLNLKDTIKLIQKRPDVKKGEMVTQDKQLAFLIEGFSDKEISEILQSKSNNKTQDQLKENVRFWSFVYVDVDLLQPKLIYKISMQTDETINKPRE